MGIVLLLLAVACGIVSLVCWIMTLIKLFQNEGVGQGIFGIICSIYAFIMGFVRMKAWNYQKIMTIWTISIVLGFILNIAASAMMASDMASQMNSGGGGY